MLISDLYLKIHEFLPIDENTAMIILTVKKNPQENLIIAKNVAEVDDLLRSGDQPNTWS